jgi:hypothetical protein
LIESAGDASASPVVLFAGLPETLCVVRYRVTAGPRQINDQHLFPKSVQHTPNVDHFL